MSGFWRSVRLLACYGRFFQAKIGGAWWSRNPLYSGRAFGKQALNQNYIVLRGNVKETRLAPFAYDDAAAKQLFDQLQERAGVRYALEPAAASVDRPPRGG